MDQKGHQSINCTVSSCQHFEQSDNGCRLHSIQVSPLSNAIDSAQESMCQSFERKDQ